MQEEYKDYSEADLWREFKNGSEPAFNFIFEKYVRVLYSYGRKFTDDTDLLEDCVQDLFVELWEKKHLLKDTDSIRYYLYKSLRLRVVRALSQQNRLGKRQDAEEELNFEISFSHEALLINLQLAEEQKNAIDEALTLLSRRQKEAVYLRYFDNLSYEEISSVMAISIEAVYKLVSAALATLKKHTRKAYFLFIWCSILQLLLPAA